MSYLYKKPTPKPIPATNEIVMPSIPEKVETTSHITEITYEEHLKNIEMMCKADRAFMKRVREFCEEHREENFPNVTQLPEGNARGTRQGGVTSEPASEHKGESE